MVETHNPAGLDDTLVDLINVVAIADAAPTKQAREVSEEIIGKVDEKIAGFEALLKGDVAALNAAAKTAGFTHLSA